MKKIALVLLVAILFTTALSGCGGQNPEPASDDVNSAQAYEKANLRLANNGADTASDTIFARMFAEKVKERSDGAIVIEVFNNDQLAGGNQTKGIEMLSQGMVDFGVYSCLTSGAVLDEKLLTPTIPFSFIDYQEATKYFSSTGGEYFKDLLANKKLVYLGAIHNGMRQFSNNKQPIITPADMKNLKIRVPGNEMFIDIFKTLGADPIAMSWSEVFTALQQGTIDGQDNGFKTSASTKMYEVQKHFSRVNYMYDAFLITAYSDSFKKLPEKSQELIRTIAAECIVEVNKLVEDEEEKLIEQFRSEYGVVITELTEEQVNVFREALQPVIEKYKNKFGADACAAFGIE